MLSCALLLAAAAAAPGAQAASRPADAAPTAVTGAEATSGAEPTSETAADAPDPLALAPWEHRILETRAFVSSHPDLYQRDRGVRALAAGDAAKAHAALLKAAHLGDKPSQALLAELHMEGIGVPRDPALAYVWMDLAVERAYPEFLARRELYWSRLSPEERASALEKGAALYDAYGDAATEPRMAKALRKARRASGWRTSGSTHVEVMLIDDGIVVQGAHFYAPRFWKPDRYRALQDALWTAPREGRVDVGELETVRNDPPPEPR